MSFVSEVKDELTRVEAICSHCDRALLAALVRVEGTLQFSGAHKYRLEISTETKRCFIDDLRVCTYKDETPTSITVPSEPYFTTTVPTYDLYGRRVTGPLPTGIYIRGGRKILIR